MGSMMQRREDDGLPAAMPLHIDRPGAAPIALHKLTLLAGLEVPKDVTSPLWIGARVMLANGEEREGAVRIMPPQRQEGAPTVARLSGLLIVSDERLVDPLRPRERATLALRARDVIPFRVMLANDLPYPLHIGEPGPYTPLTPGSWSRKLSAVDVAWDVSRLAPL